jgi:hypothetical protein
VTERVMKIIKFAKKMYFLLFSFILGKSEKKFDKYAAHFFTIHLFVFIFIYLMQIIIYLIGGVADAEGAFAFIVVAPLGIVAFSCLAKFGILLSKK